MLSNQELAPIVAQMGIVFHTPDDIVNTLDAYHIEQLEDQDIKIWLSPEEIQEHDLLARKLTIKVMKYEQLVKDFSEYMKKGSITGIDEKIGDFIKPVKEFGNESNCTGYQFFPPELEGIGINALKAQVEYHVKLADKGFINEKGTVYGIVNEKSMMIEYVTAQGKPAGVPARPMTAGQKNNYFGNNKPVVSDGE
jgi:hypothetical protein